MRTDSASLFKRNDYQPYPYQLLSTHLEFDLDLTSTRVVSTLVFQGQPGRSVPLVLNGQALTLIKVAINHQEITPAHYKLDEQTLTLYPAADHFTVTIVSQCEPIKNSTLMGLYASGQSLFTQCEAEGFRRITWFPDRPDVMSIYTVVLRANQTQFPILLSNGNLIGSQLLNDGRHETTWHDPHRKPSYLFALVAGQFDINETHIQTQSGRNVLLQIYSDPGTREKTHWALSCLERALRWDETRFNLELDLDRFMIVATRDFNMGAMENKGLNIFNANYVLASPQTATDQTYQAIEAVIGHEYFHNWTGNRVTCRDWFQLSLKEGLTVFREQEFSADMLAQRLDAQMAKSARAVKRIDDVDLLRSHQFPEDAGPMAHPIRPESYYEISNFYTATIYEKGAEVIRMLQTLLGLEGFKQGLAEYFKRHDGQAVTCDDFIAAMETVYTRQNPGKSLHVFRRWYQQAGTPHVKVDTHFDASQHSLTLTLTQNNPPVGIETQQKPVIEKLPLHIPLALSFLDQQGQALTPASTVLELTEKTQTWTFPGFKSPPVLSLLHDFSAPVIIDSQRSSNDLSILALHDSNPFARWEAIQELLNLELTPYIEAARQQKTLPNAPSTELIQVWGALLHDTTLAPDYLSRVLRLPAIKQLLQKHLPMHPQAVYVAHQTLFQQLGQHFGPLWLARYQQYEAITQNDYNPSASQAGQRSLRHLALAYYLAHKPEHGMALAQAHYHNANNLTDRLGALGLLTRYGTEQASQACLDDFYHKAQNDAQQMDHWFSLQATARWASVKSIQALAHHPQFSIRNPNRTRALLFQYFLNNHAANHHAGVYPYWAEQILTIDALNPEVASRLTRGLDNWAQFDQPFQHGMKTALETIIQHPDLSSNVGEIVRKALAS